MKKQITNISVLACFLASICSAQAPIGPILPIGGGGGGSSDSVVQSAFPSSLFQLSRLTSTATLSTINSATIAAGTCGQLIPSNTGSTTINSIDTFLSTVVSAGGSTWNASLYAMATASGPPGQPTGAALATGTVVMSGGNTPSNSWQELALSGNYVATAYQQICVGWYITNYTGSDSVILKAVTIFNTMSTANTWTATSWTTTPAFTGGGNAPILALKMSDGSYGTLLGAYPGPSSTVVSIAYNSGSAANEVGLRFSLANATSVSGVCLTQPTNAVNQTFTINLYDSNSTLLQTLSPNNQQMFRNGIGDIYCQDFAPISLSASSVYRIGIIATTVNNLTLNYFPVNANKFMTLLEGGTQFYYTSRSGAGAWTDDTAKRPFIGL